MVVTVSLSYDVISPHTVRYPKNSYRIKFRSDCFNSPVVTRMSSSQMDSQILICSRLETVPRVHAQMMEEIIDKVGNLLFRPLVVWCQSRVERDILGRLRFAYGVLNDRNKAEGRN